MSIFILSREGSTFSVRACYISSLSLGVCVNTHSEKHTCVENCNRYRAYTCKWALVKSEQNMQTTPLSLRETAYPHTIKSKHAPEHKCMRV
ncbi:hypothetical protein POVWA2_051220 [Plasmodium ovale wallikeri]|uniref:Uncharacterized protein n=1 Tax=Plasmodium ovale wallikeri TaxID=864142 RepID=A0A1A8ZQD0_PLAOA|nr:hypothetical protein POVWA1_051850 [Plasmodium ovale wallikeri]SBT46037.1 hypothetical protein POVWA2_051220 [Plasmodium ovale wallikeri]